MNYAAKPHKSTVLSDSPTEAADFCVTSVIVVKYPIYLSSVVPAICAELLARDIASAKSPADIAAAISTALCLCKTDYFLHGLKPTSFQSVTRLFLHLCIVTKSKSFRTILQSYCSTSLSGIVVESITYTVITCMNPHYHEYLGFNHIFILTFFLLSYLHAYCFQLRCGVRLQGLPAFRFVSYTDYSIYAAYYYG